MLGHQGHTAGGGGKVVAVGLLDTHTKDVFGSGPIRSQDLRTHVPVPLPGALYPVSGSAGCSPGRGLAHCVRSFTSGLAAGRGHACEEVILGRVEVLRTGCCTRT